MSPRRKEISTLNVSILAFFLDRSYHGYELYKFITQKVEFQAIWRIKQSLFYSLLENFFKEGFLQLQILPGDQYPDRKEYQITESGRKFVLAWLIEPVHHGRDMRQEFLAKLFFATHKNDDSAIKLIQNQKRESKSWLHQITNQTNSLSFYQDLINEYRIYQINAMLDWLNIVEEKVKAMKSDSQS